MTRPLLPVVSAVLAGLAFPLFAAEKTEAEIAAKRAEICAEAEARYVDQYGHASADAEGVTVVTMYKYNFCPREITIPAGTTVRWVNVEKRTSHSVVVKGEPESIRAFPDEVIEFTFPFPGDAEDYLCGPHWESHDMIGRITVTEAKNDG